ncbi:MAG: acyl carrier protein [Legionellaceae bacterium]|nr:acyl carrier protein [Legionellaceae bacterium]HBF06882.1 acyl carrier protein [Gammaproteobacteria bacterium]HCA89424.1 acyl carrier protein [Legionellales bacterium]|tara:strand:- start:941 stop:1354 length:414 start_codon:yes stop_codon:yes gene_type:complete
MNAESVYPKVRSIIADVLVIEEEDITPDSRLIADLGAESIDFLDLVFQLEKEFEIKIPRGQLQKSARGELSEAQFEQKGMVTAEGMTALKQYLSEVPAQYFGDTLKVNDIPTLFTVQTFCKLVVQATKDQKMGEVAL